MSNLPKQITKTLFIHFLPDNHSADQENLDRAFQVCDFDASGSEYSIRVLIGTQEMTLDIPQDVDVVGTQIATLREQKQKALAEGQRKANEIEEKIQSLLALEHVA